MSIHEIAGEFIFYKGEKKAELKYRLELSQLIKDKYGNGPFAQADLVRDVVSFSLNYYISKFRAICLAETSLAFYENVFWLHEKATEFVYKNPHCDASPEVSRAYIATYRRILKYVLEMGCEVQLVTGELFSEAAKEISTLLDDLLFLGDMIFTCVQLYAEHAMIEDVADVSFDEHGLYVFGRRHHYDAIFEHFNKELGSQLTKSVANEHDLEHFVEALKNCFGIKYADVSHIIAYILQETKKQGDVVGIEPNDLPFNLHNAFGVPFETAKQFFDGLSLDRQNKMSLLDLACRPYQFNRYLYRPLLLWNVNGKDLLFLGANSLTESIYQIVTNAIPWGKAPAEWLKNKCFKNYMHRKEDEHDKWLDDAVEKMVKALRLPYDRNTTQLNTSQKVIQIDVVGLGEIDFIIVVESLKRVYVADCKHLRGRYDMADQKNDFNAFVKGSKNNTSYNQKLSNKLKWFNGNKSLLEEHFRLKYPDQNFSFSDYMIEGIFIVNTPTFYMYNADYRIFTVDQMEVVLRGQFVDPIFMILNEEENSQTISNICFPYFKKPEYVGFDPFVDD